MRGRIDVAEGVDRHVRVDLRRRDRGVPEELLHHSHVGTALQQVRREGVPQRVRRDVCRDLRAVGGRADHEPGALTRQRRAACSQEEPCRRASSRGEPGSHPREVRVDGGTCIGPDRNDALLRALAPEAQHVTVGEVIDIEPDGLGYAGAGRIEQLQQGAIPDPDRLIRRRRVEETLHLVDREGLRKSPRRLRRTQPPARVVGVDALAHQEPMPPAHRRLQPCQARRRGSGVGRCALRDEAVDHRGRHLRGVRDPGGQQPLPVSLEIAAVRRDRVRAQSALHGHVPQVGVEGALEQHLSPGRAASAPPRGRRSRGCRCASARRARRRRRPPAEPIRPGYRLPRLRGHGRQRPPPPRWRGRCG